MSTVRLTVGQAIVRFLAEQYVERDGEQQRFIAGVWGIFGHGNVAGSRPGARGARRRVRHALLPPAERAGHGPHSTAAYARHTNRLQTFACTSLDRPGRDEHDHRRGDRDRQPAPGPAVPERLLREPARRSRPPAGRAPASSATSARTTRSGRSRATSTGSAGPEQLLSSLPEAFRVLTDPAETGAVTVSLPEDVQAEAFDWPAAFFERRVWRIRRPAPEREVVEPGRRGSSANAKRPLDRRRRRRDLRGGDARRSTAFATRFGIPVAESQAGKGALPWNHPMNVGPVGAAGGLAANRLARDADLVIADRHAARRLRDRVEDRVPGPRASRSSGSTSAPMDAAKLRRAARWSPTRARPSRRSPPRSRRPAGRHGGRLPGADRRGEGRVGRGRSIATARARAAPATPTASSPSPRSSASSTTPSAGRRRSSARRAACRATCSSCGAPRTPRRTTSSTATRAWATRSPAGLGIQLADPERQVVVMVGDGSYLMLNSEIVTAVAERLPITVVVLRQPRLPVHPRPRARPRRPRLRQRAALPRSGRPVG